MRLWRQEVYFPRTKQRRRRDGEMDKVVAVAFPTSIMVFSFVLFAFIKSFAFGSSTSLVRGILEPSEDSAFSLRSLAAFYALDPSL